MSSGLNKYSLKEGYRKRSFKNLPKWDLTFWKPKVDKLITTIKDVKKYPRILASQRARLEAEKVLQEFASPTIVNLPKPFVKTLMLLADVSAKMFGYAPTTRHIALRLLAYISVYGKGAMKSEAETLFRRDNTNPEDYKNTIRALEYEKSLDETRD